MTKDTIQPRNRSSINSNRNTNNYNNDEIDCQSISSLTHLSQPVEIVDLRSPTGSINGARQALFPPTAGATASLTVENSEDGKLDESDEHGHIAEPASPVLATVPVLGGENAVVPLIVDLITPTSNQICHVVQIQDRVRAESPQGALQAPDERRAAGGGNPQYEHAEDAGPPPEAGRLASQPTIIINNNHYNYTTNNYYNNNAVYFGGESHIHRGPRRLAGHRARFPGRWYVWCVQCNRAIYE